MKSDPLLGDPGALGADEEPVLLDLQAVELGELGPRPQAAVGHVEHEFDFVFGRHVEGVDLHLSHPGLLVGRLGRQLDPLLEKRAQQPGHLSRCGHRPTHAGRRQVAGGGEAPGAVNHQPDPEALGLGLAQRDQVVLPDVDALDAVPMDSDVAVGDAGGPGHGVQGGIGQLVKR